MHPKSSPHEQHLTSVASRPFPDAPRRIPGDFGRCLVTIEVSESWLQWSATPVSRRRRSGWSSQSVDVGYGQPDRLIAWFDEFWTLNGSRRHELHLLVSGPDILQRSFFVPEVPPRELRAVVTSQAKHVFPFDIRTGLFAYRRIDRFERSGVPTLEIHALALGGNWPSLIDRIFGSRLCDVTLITSTGQKTKPWLEQVSNSFAEEDTLLVRLNGNVLEAAFYRRGEQEFFRETVIDSLPPLKAGLGDDNWASESQVATTNPRVFADIRRVIRDALDYYLGQTPDRHVQTVYLCLPPAFDEEINLYVDTELNARAVSLTTPAFAERHLKNVGLRSLGSRYCSLCSLLPPLGPVDSLINLLPERVKSQRRLRRFGRLGRVALAAVLISIAVISSLQYLEYRQLSTLLQRQLSQVTELEQHPLISDLNNTTRRASLLRGELQPFNRQPDPGLRYAMQVLSSIAREGVALERVQLNPRQHGGSTLTVDGKVRSDQGRQESLLYAYLIDLKATAGIGKVDLLSKNSTQQFGQRTVHFTARAEVGQ
jgi:hypothetical protein